MGIGNFFRNQLAEVIRWDDPSPNLLVWKYPSANDEIKNASKLLIGPGQGALLVYEGAVTDILEEPGIYDLETENHPFITTLLRLRTAFESEHKMLLFFYRKSENVAQGWGTAQPIKYLDPIYGFPVEVGANGSFSFKITDAGYLFTEVTGARDAYTVTEARQLLQSRFPQAIAAVLATAGVSYQNIDSQLPDLAALITAQLTPELRRLGFALTDFKLNGTQFDEGTKKRIDQVSDVLAESLAAGKGGLSYVEMEKLKALRDAARNEGGLAGAGLQLGAGMELGKTFNNAKEEQLNSTPADPVQKLQQLKLLLNEGIITQEEFDAKKKEWLSKF
jgi:membrane protease subunit (stomatin/prohibitin family)